MDLKFWDKTSPLTLMDGKQHTPEEVYAKFPHVKGGVVVLEYTSPEVVSGIDSLVILRSAFGISDGLSDEEALAAIIERRTNSTAGVSESEMEELRAQNEDIMAALVELAEMAFGRGE